MGKLLESTTLRRQAANNSKAQFATSPDLNTELVNAIISALDAHTTMSTLDVQRGLKDILLNQASCTSAYEGAPNPRQGWTNDAGWD
jgi:type I restriction enzyme R subunit